MTTEPEAVDHVTVEFVGTQADLRQSDDQLRAENERLREALRRRNEPPTLANLLARSQRNCKSRTWRLVGYLVRCVQRAEAERDALQREVDGLRSLIREVPRPVPPMPKPAVRGDDQ